MKVGDLVRMISPDSACADEVGVIIDIYLNINRNLVLFYDKDCKLACADEELKLISENYYLDPNQGQA